MKKIKLLSVILIGISFIYLNCDFFKVVTKEQFDDEKNKNNSSTNSSSSRSSSSSSLSSSLSSSSSSNSSILSSSSSSSEVSINAIWQKMYGGSGEDCPYDMQKTSDGGYIVTGYSYSTNILGCINHGGQDIYVIKLNADCEIIWQKLYGGAGSDCSISIIQTTDGGYIISGSSTSTDISGTTNHGSQDCYFIKLDSTGNVEWQKMYGGANFDWPGSILQTGDNGYIISGYSNSTNISGVTNHGDTDLYIIKLDTGGNILWQKMYGGLKGEGSYKIIKTIDNCFIISGYSYSTDITGVTNKGGQDLYIVKLDASGDILWQNMYGGSSNEWGFSIIQLTDGSYIASGYSSSTNISGLTNHGGQDYYIIKLNSTGDVIWQKMYGGSGNENARYIIQSSDNGFLIAGESYSTNISGVINNGDDDFYIMKLNSSGDFSWQRMIGGSGRDWPNCAIQSSDGNYIIMGYSGSSNISGVTSNGSSDVYLLKINGDGN